MRVRLTHVAAVLALGSAFAFAASARGTATATINGKKVTIDYGRPALKGRAARRPAQAALRGPGVAERRRSGHHAHDRDRSRRRRQDRQGREVLGLRPPAPDGSRNLILNTDLGQPLGSIFAGAPDNMKNAPWPYIGNYQAKIADKEVLRVPLKKETVTAPVDVFTIDLAPAADAAKLKLSWGDESWSIDLKKAAK